MAGSARGRRSGRPAARPVDVAVLTDDVAARLRARGERMTNPRRVVLEVLAGRPGHVGAEELVHAVAAVDPGVHRASVYRVLEAFTDLGVVQHVHLGHGATAYHLADDDGPHLHVQCRGCGVVLDAPDDVLDEASAVLRRTLKFRLDPGHVALSGTCAACAQAGARR